jgi:hypothetical protein
MSSMNEMNKLLMYAIATIIFLFFGVVSMVNIARKNLTSNHNMTSRIVIVILLLFGNL